MAPQHYRKILFELKNMRADLSLATHYVRTQGHLLGPAVEVWEFDLAYCGGGISATIDLFLLHQLGFEDLALYDASMSEWAKDRALPIETR